MKKKNEKIPAMELKQIYGPPLIERIYKTNQGEQKDVTCHTKDMQKSIFTEVT